MGKAIKLNIKSDFNFILIGIVSSEPIYRLSWLLNEQMGLKFSEGKALKLKHIKSKVEQSFSLFAYTNDKDGGIFELIQNKSENGALIEEQKNIDYLLKISFADINVTEFVALLKRVENINLALSIEPGSLKSKNRLIISEEKN